MSQDRRLAVNLRTAGKTRIGVKDRGYFGPDRRNSHDRRSYIERRRDKYLFSESSIF